MAVLHASLRSVSARGLSGDLRKQNTKVATLLFLVSCFINSCFYCSVKRWTLTTNFRYRKAFLAIFTRPALMDPNTNFTRDSIRPNEPHTESVLV